VLLGPNVKRGLKITRTLTHYNLLRTIEDELHLGTLGKCDAKNSPITGFLKRPTSNPKVIARRTRNFIRDFEQLLLKLQFSHSPAPPISTSKPKKKQKAAVKSKTPPPARTKKQKKSKPTRLTRKASKDS
jgi:hypothetical protein